MVKKLRVLILLGLLLSLSIPVNAGTPPHLFSVETYSGDTAYFDYRGAAQGFLKTVEVVTTNDTVTTAESGKIFLINATSGQVVLTLPTAAIGLEYVFTAINGSGIVGQGRIVLDPVSTDTFFGCTQPALTTFTFGDRLASPTTPTTGDTVTITAISSNRWACTDREGTWLDFN